jgi:hypothetical protein
MTSIFLSAPLRRVARGMIFSCGLLLGLGNLTGCASKTPSEPPGAPPEKIATLRESIQKNKPGSLVGPVIATYQLYAAVADIPVKEVKLGQTITFVDPDGNPVNNGTVASILEDTIHVKFDATGKRPVQRGDLAVILKD